MLKKAKNILITWEGILAIPIITFFMFFAFGVIAALNPQIGIDPAQYLQEIVYKLTVVVIGSNIVQLLIFINLMLFFKFSQTDLKTWFTEASDSQKLWVVVCFYALYYLVYALARL